MNLLHPVLIYGRMIKFSHSVFALPFALSGAALAATVDGISLSQVGWIIVAMVAARSAAMGFNRIADRDFDAANPRTRNRELPRGIVSPFAAGLFVFLSAGLLVWVSAQLNPLCLYLSPVAIAIIFLYSYTKRFTWLSHLVLGSCLGLAPLGAWIAVTGRFDLPPVILGLSVLSWVAGFDILYSCQDKEFDSKSGLHSIPVRFGLKRSLHIARGLHTLAVLLMGLLGHLMHMDIVYFAGVIFITALLAYEHALVNPDDLTKVNMAFMTMNSLVSLTYFAFTLADLLLLHGNGEAFSWVRTTFATPG
jgi:4-hydroxybenzoate polyprenyltransferase